MLEEQARREVGYPECKTYVERGEEAAGEDILLFTAHMTALQLYTRECPPMQHSYREEQYVYRNDGDSKHAG